MVLAGVENLWVLADVSEARLPQVTAGSPAQVQVAALPGQRFEGKVAHISPALNPDTRTGSVRVEGHGLDRGAQLVPEREPEVDARLRAHEAAAGRPPSNSIGGSSSTFGNRQTRRKLPISFFPAIVTTNWLSGENATAFRALKLNVGAPGQSPRT